MVDFPNFERYRPIVDDWSAFADALGRPLPTCIWTNTLRTTPDALTKYMGKAGFEMEPIDWYPDAFRVSDAVPVGATLPFVSGWYQVQEEAALLPVALLDLRCGQRVLDLCAAPGNKTAQAAVQMGDEGLVMANDVSERRLRMLPNLLQRLGLTSVATVVSDARAFPVPELLFDTVIADVPCSCEGTVRKHPRAHRRAGQANSLRLQRLQMDILRRAVDLCRVGGTVVYATCTFAPEENEAVVDAALREQAGHVQVRPVSVPQLHTTPGLTAWEESGFDASIQHALRLWPHHNDTGGFFVAVLDKTG
ncbi:MAG: RsmB/NOP family class I SAM-dependent RNA methyltransferase [Rhodothermales bacterium]